MLISMDFIICDNSSMPTELNNINKIFSDVIQNQRVNIICD